MAGHTTSHNISEDGQGATAQPEEDFEDRHALNRNGLTSAEAGPAASAYQPRLTPRKLLRKAVPKRKRMEAMQREAGNAAAQGTGPSLVCSQFLCVCYAAVMPWYACATDEPLAM